ncbi:MAG: IS200/IS605 family transposase [Sphingobacteriales bacterium]|nr:IS200/IS605 family transposase [Sphingobacteriales bacterium]
MAGTFSQVYIQAVFAVKGRENMISPQWSGRLHSFMAGIINAKKQKAIIVNGMADHIHIFFGLRPVMSIAEVVRDVKSCSANFINRNNWVRGRFSWQEGYGTFSYTQSHVNDVYHYILNQQEHHRKKTFKEEYTALLEYFEVEFNEKYLFEYYE